jgi:hypothetical protein
MECRSLFSSNNDYFTSEVKKVPRGIEIVFREEQTHLSNFPPFSTLVLLITTALTHVLFRKDDDLTIIQSDVLSRYSGALFQCLRAVLKDKFKRTPMMIGSRHVCPLAAAL